MKNTVNRGIIPKPSFKIFLNNIAISFVRINKFGMFVCLTSYGNIPIFVKTFTDNKLSKAVPNEITTVYINFLKYNIFNLKSNAKSK